MNSNNPKRSQSVSSLLPYWRTEVDYILHVDGRITGGFELVGLSLECLSEESLDRHQNQLKLFLHALPREVELQILYQIRPFSPVLTRFKEETKKTTESLRYIWEEKSDFYRQQSNIWHTKLYLFVTLPPVGLEQGKGFFEKISKSLRRMTVAGVQQEIVQWSDKRYNAIHQTLREIQSALGFLEIPVRELSCTEIEEIIYQILNPIRSLQIPYSPMARTSGWPPDRLLREELVYSPMQVHPRELVLDDQIHRVMTLKDVPQIQYAGIINRLLTLREFPLNISVGLKVDSPDAVLSRLKRSEVMQQNLQKGRGRNYQAEQQQSVLSETIQALVRGDMKVFQVSLALHYWATGENDLANSEARLRQEIHQMGEAKELREEFSYPEIFISMLPGCSYLNYRTLPPTTPQALTLLPLYQNTRGSVHPVALFKNRTDELVGLDPFNSKLSAYNGVIFGPTGRGKSFLAQYLLLQYLRINPKIMIIDIGGSYRRFTSLIGGDYVELRQENPVSLNPFLPRKEPEPELIGFLAGVVERMVRNEGEMLGKITQHLIRESIKELYQKENFPKDLEGLRVLFAEKGQTLDDTEDQTICRSLAKKLALWTEGEAKGLLIGKKSLSLQSPVITVDLAGLSSNKELQGIAIQILTGLVWQQVQHYEGPKILIFDEVWQHLKDPTAAKLLDQLYRTARKHYTSVLSISQQLEDFLDEEIKTSIIANSATRFILRTDRELSQLRQVFQLNDNELQLIQSLSMRKGYFSEVFAAVGDEHQVLRIEPSPTEYWLCTTHPSDLLVEREIIKKHPSVRERVEWLAKQYPRGVS